MSHWYQHLFRTSSPHTDALSHAPLFTGPEEEEELAIDTARTCLTQMVEKNPELKMILDGLD